MIIDVVPNTSNYDFSYQEKDHILRKLFENHRSWFWSHFSNYTIEHFMDDTSWNSHSPWSRDKGLIHSMFAVLIENNDLVKLFRMTVNDEISEEWR